MTSFDNSYMALTKAKIDVVSPTNAKITLEPLERGFGDTLGNALRRVLLSSMPGSAVSEVKIEGVQHEYAPIEGCQEDAIDILLNLKELSVKLTGAADSVQLKLSCKGPCVVTAQDIETPTGVEIINIEHVICNLNKDGNINMDIKVETGYGYRTIDHGVAGSNEEIGVLQLDTTFSPVLRVAYNVENARVGDRTDLDKLIIHLETNGTLDPNNAIRDASALLQQQLMAISGMTEQQLTSEEVPGEPSTDPLLNRQIDELGLPVRAINCLKQENIFLIGDLVHCDETYLMKTPNLGKVSLNDIKTALEARGLQLNMTIENWMKPTDTAFGEY